MKKSGSFQWGVGGVGWWTHKSRFSANSVLFDVVCFVDRLLRKLAGIIEVPIFERTGGVTRAKVLLLHGIQT